MIRGRKNVRGFIVVGLILVVVGGRVLGGGEGDAGREVEATIPAARGNEVTYDVDFSVVVTPPYQAKVLKVWLPVATSDVGQEMGESRFSSFPMKVEPKLGREEVYGNRFAYFEFREPKGAQILRHQFRIKVWELNWNIRPEMIERAPSWPAGYEKYLRGDSQAVIVDDRFRQVLNEIVPKRVDRFADLESVLTWVQKNAEYDHLEASLSANSEHLLTRRRGHCSDYHSFCAALGRELGVPTRLAYGINPFPKNSPSHCKLEAYLPPYGWVSFDVSETQKLVNEIRKSKTLDEGRKKKLVERAEERLMKGFRDNTWFAQTRGTDYELEPKASKRVAVVRTAYVEADGVALPDPDPADKSEKGFSWMTVHEYRGDREVSYPFTDWKSLEVEK